MSGIVLVVGAMSFFGISIASGCLLVRAVLFSVIVSLVVTGSYVAREVMLVSGNYVG